jgi:hypothetical protein
MINKELVSEYFDYRDGYLYWKKVTHPNKSYLIGQEVGFIHSTGYRHVTWLGKQHKVHRLIYLFVHGYMPKEIDHINGNRADNSIENLREVTRSQNQCNKTMCSSNTSGYKGVSWHKRANKWSIRLTKNGEIKHFGYYDDLELAGLVALEARNLHFGKYNRI